jgi:hypothetical protein
MSAKVNTQHKDYAAMIEKWQRCRDTVSGQDAVHAAGETYLPKLKDQSTDDYNAYVKRAQFYNAVWRTISALSGMIFRKVPVIDVTDSISKFLEDVTMGGVNFHTFAQQTSIEILTSGRRGILVDYPQESTTGKTLAEVEKMGLRPTMQAYNAETIINWKTTRINNQTMLSMVVLTEDAEIATDSEFEVKTETHYRVLDLVYRSVNDGGGLAYRVRLYRINDKKEDEQIGADLIPLMNGKPLNYIPFYFIGIDDTTPAVDEPPLIDLVDVNLDHYRLDADYKHGLHFTGLPTLFISGYTPEENSAKLYIGSASANCLPDPQSKAYFVEFEGQGLQAIEKAKQSDEQQMAILGARLLSSEKKDAETAQTAQIHRAGESSILSAIAQTISIGLTKALNTFCEWAGSPGEWSIELNRDFLPIEMTPQELTVILQSWQAGLPGFSDQGVFDMLQKREVVATDVTLEEEQERIKNKPIPTPPVVE